MDKLETKDYLPEVHGTIRAKYEHQTTMGAGRFEVRNARISLTGNILPIVAYKAEIDLSDEGSIKMLDAYARLFPAKGLTVTAGQMRVPFTIDAHRSPHQQYFANRSFIAKQVGNVRDVGVTLGYTLPTDLPITVEGGLYNGSGLTNQKEWHKEVNYSAKARFLFTEGLNLTLSVQSIQPEEVRVQSYDIGAYYEFNRFHIEGEYLYKQYSDNAFKDVQAVNTFINYDLPLRKVFNKMSFLLRYDMMTDFLFFIRQFPMFRNNAINDFRRLALCQAVNILLQCQSVIGNQCCQIPFLCRRNRCIFLDRVIKRQGFSKPFIVRLYRIQLIIKLMGADRIV